jgi:hypothetical protein
MVLSIATKLLRSTCFAELRRLSTLVCDSLSPVKGELYLRFLFPVLWKPQPPDLLPPYWWICRSCSTGLVRTRDPSILATCDIVVDVGGEYIPSKHRYDHHQRGFNEVFGHGFNTKLSSAGLIYKLVNSILCYDAIVILSFDLLQAFWQRDYFPADGL